MFGYFFLEWSCVWWIGNWSAPKQPYMSCLLFEIQVSRSLTATHENSVYAWPMEDGAQGRHLLIATDDFCNFLPQLPWF